MNKTILFTVAIASSVVIISCGGGAAKSGADSPAVENKAPVASAATVKDDRLSGFMLGGIYFIKGYGGQQALNGMIQRTDKAAIISKYKELMEFPYKPSDGGPDAKNLLKEWWSVNNKEDLQKAQEQLKTGSPENPHKAWDYARMVQNACMGYAAGYLTQEETNQQIAAVLPLARKAFNNWDAYFTDFVEGRKAWGGDPSHNKEFEDLAKEILQGDKSIYKILPLN
ncbi:MAG TPA: DUF1266 domain-containing protein [Chitinophaga sp.]|uniref:DUF1266 domain-containing protein n=1 Tax=Chitinophaga sp. TaxID=1869181 RepID=UPI002B825087|nr:DUF1266 domain-containing protein [Chitinophaga sp.]HVI48807.1 DUF1266 domain-containing protein [Chitinophaga sp.]